MFIDHQLLIGVLSGIISTLIICLVSKFTNNYLLSKIGEKIYQVSDINGAWTVFYTDCELKNPSGYMTIKQTGYKIEAVLELTKNQIGLDIKRYYDYYGKFSAAKLALIFEDRDAKGEYFGTVVMHYKHGNQTLSGKSMYYCHKEDKVVYTRYTFVRGKVSSFPEEQSIK